MHILGLANGTLGGNSEILLKSALRAAQEADPSITASWVHIPSVSIPTNPPPLPGALDVSLGHNSAMAALHETGKLRQATVPDDRQALMNAVLDADAFIFASPVYSHSPAGTLKAVFDRIGGPFFDFAFAEMVLEGQKRGDPQFAQFKVDPRILKPRVVAYICVGGSTTPDQITMALPMMHLNVNSLGARVVDQVIFQGAASPGSVIARDNGKALERTAELGRNVASQLGKGYGTAKYLGDAPDGACPYCHLSKVDLLGNNRICCITCGTQGTIAVSTDSVIRPIWNYPCGVSSLTKEGMTLHLGDIHKESLKEAEEMKAHPDFQLEKQRWEDLKFPLVPLPSQL